MAATDRYLLPGVDYQFSASQISAWMACRRKWGWTYLMGLRGPSTESQALGTRVHGQIEKWLLHDEPFDFTTEEGEIIAAGLGHIPSPHDGMLIEGKKRGDTSPDRKSFVFRGRHVWMGYKDLEFTEHVYDWKTSKDIARWGKTEDDLLYDPQSVLYARHNGAPVVSLNWVYFQTKKPRKSKHVALQMLQEHAQKGFEVLESCADEAMSAVLGARGLDGQPLRDYILALPYNAHECEAYGGCQFRGLCNLSPQERFAAQMKQANGGAHQSLADRMQLCHTKIKKSDEPKELHGGMLIEKKLESRIETLTEDGRLATLITSINATDVESSKNMGSRNSNIRQCSTIKAGYAPSAASQCTQKIRTWTIIMKRE